MSSPSHIYGSFVSCSLARAESPACIVIAPTIQFYGTTLDDHEVFDLLRFGKERVDEDPVKIDASLLEHFLDLVPVGALLGEEGGGGTSLVGSEDHRLRVKLHDRLDDGEAGTYTTRDVKRGPTPRVYTPTSVRGALQQRVHDPGIRAVAERVVERQPSEAVGDEGGARVGIQESLYNLGVGPSPTRAVQGQALVGRFGALGNETKDV